uniref:(northern house mosquito) hypothetical protein n=1 Tax=Culex pipiens TaxID=7175 RepID=A0A8D8JET8_CULPI
MFNLRKCHFFSNLSQVLRNRCASLLSLSPCPRVPDSGPTKLSPAIAFSPANLLLPVQQNQVRNIPRSEKKTVTHIATDSVSFIGRILDRIHRCDQKPGENCFSFSLGTCFVLILMTF